MALSNFSAEYFVISKAYAERHGLREDLPVERRLAAIRQFRGIRCGISSPGSITDVITRLILNQAGLDPAADATLVPLDSTSNSEAALLTGAIDGFVAWPPSPEFAISKFGAIPLLSVGKGEVGGFKNLTARSSRQGHRIPSGIRTCSPR